MKKALFAVLIMFFLLWNCGGILAQGPGEGKRLNRKEEQAKRSRKKPRVGQAGAYEPDEQARRKRMRELRRKGKERFKAGKGKGLGQQLEAVQKQIAQEEAKHLRRLARLNRIRELAVEGEATDIVKRVDKVRRKEQKRYERRHRLLKLRERILKRGKERKVRPAYDKTLRKRGEEAIKKRAYRGKQEAKGKSSPKKAEQ